MADLPKSAELYLDSNRGIYIPQNFVQETKAECINGLSDEDREILISGPENEFYWESWETVLANVTVTDPTTGITFDLYQDGDLWIVPTDADWPESDY